MKSLLTLLNTISELLPPAINSVRPSTLTVPVAVMLPAAVTFRLPVKVMLSKTISFTSLIVRLRAVMLTEFLKSWAAVRTTSWPAALITVVPATSQPFALYRRPSEFNIRLFATSASTMCNAVLVVIETWSAPRMVISPSIEFPAFKRLRSSPDPAPSPRSTVKSPPIARPLPATVD